jgi:alanine-glyoxylate transaminase/serine-glyoxylate transaminase/serine-pyruvate transaminase
MATALGLRPEIIAGDWRSGVRAEQIEETLLADKEHTYKAVAVVHNETSTGVTSNIEAVRRAIDNAKHPALLLVDTISSLGSIDYRHDEWGVDVTVGGSQKGLMLPPGLGFNAVSAKALEASKTARLARSFLGWGDMLASNAQGFFPYTPSTNLLQGLKVALDLIEAEGLANIFARHDRAALATRRAVQRWGFEIQCRNEEEYSSSLTAVRLPQGHSADALRRQVLQDANLSLGNGLGPLADRVFRIGHLGDFSDASVLGTLAAIEMGLKTQAVPYGDGAIGAAIEALSDRRTSMAEAAE